MKPGIFVSLLFFSLSVSSQTGRDYLQQMYKKYASHWYTSLSFEQTTEQYRNDSLVKKSYWYEALRFPDDFRIDTDPALGSGVIYTKDSTYVFRNNELKRTLPGGNPFTFFLGGMYFFPFDSVVKEFISRGYDPSKSAETTWNGKPTLVIGASKTDSSGNSLWVDKKDLYVVRQIEYEDGKKIDAQMEGHQKLGNGWSETHVNIYVENKLVQVESYKDLAIDKQLPDILFDRNNFGKYHWFE